MRRAPRLVARASAAPMRITDAKARIRKILFVAMVFIKTFRTTTSDRVGFNFSSRITLTDNKEPRHSRFPLSAFRLNISTTQLLNRLVAP
jgi:hypothetical protein